MYDQEFHNKKWVFFFVSLMPHGSQQGAYLYEQEYICTYDQEYNVVYTQEF